MNILITGANRGIGLQFVTTLAKRGDTVIATARNVDEASALREVADSAENVRVVALDINDEESLERLNQLLEEEGVDLLINNAGQYTRGEGVGNFNFEGMRSEFETNVLGTLRVIQTVLPALRRGKNKKIVNISSKMGSISDNTSGGAYAYRMSKTALNMATRSLSRDLLPAGFTVLTMHPGWVQTDMGGPNALIDTETSVTGMLKVIDHAGLEESGRFWEWNGEEVPW